MHPQIAQRARLVGRVAQVYGVVGSRLRDVAMRLIPDAVTGRQLTTIQDWRPPDLAAVAIRPAETE